MPDHPITAGCRDAVRQAGVGVDRIAIIAILARPRRFEDLDHTVTTGRWPTVVAVVRGIVIAVITAFTRTAYTVATTRHGAVGQAFVRIVIVAVVAAFIAGHTRLQITARDAITTTGDAAIVATSVGIDIVAVITSFSVDRALG